ncbi:hypothetical protein BDZ89DRAFT_950441 [Hymenopellis radicata]|nr:hypothetical protein BDZ89DRAFT_950441 [Hymenopellis radicata]
MANTYVGQSQTQLQEDEERKKKKAKGSGRLNADGLPKLFTGDAFMAAAKNHHDERQAKEQEKEIRAQDGVKYATELADWKKEDAARVERNNEQRARHKVALTAWKTESERAKKEKKRPRWNKPKLGNLEKGQLRPKRRAEAAAASGSTSTPDGGENDDDDEMEDDQDAEGPELDSDGSE